MSDAGMLLYLLDGLQKNDYNTLKEWYAEHDFLNKDARIDTTLSKEE